MNEHREETKTHHYAPHTPETQYNIQCVTMYIVYVVTTKSELGLFIPQRSHAAQHVYPVMGGRGGWDEVG